MGDHGWRAGIRDGRDEGDEGWALEVEAVMRAVLGGFAHAYSVSEALCLTKSYSLSVATRQSERLLDLKKRTVHVYASWSS